METENKKMMKGGEPIFINTKSKVGALLIHGFTSTPRQFKELSEYLSSNGITVYAPLIAGHGTHPDDLIKTSPKDWQESVKEAYSKLKQSAEKIVLIGNSFGSNLALWLARELNSDPVGIITLGAPVFLRYDKLIRFRLWTYGRWQKYYQKPRRTYSIDYTDMIDEITYRFIPVKSLKDFFSFIDNETIPNLGGIKCPIIIGQATTDPVVGANSAEYIYKNIGSAKKEIYRFNSRHHVVTNDQKNCKELFQKIYSFIQEFS